MAFDFRRWLVLRRVARAEKTMRAVADDSAHAETTRKMARDAAFDIGTIRRIITPR